MQKRLASWLNNSCSAARKVEENKGMKVTVNAVALALLRRQKESQKTL